MARIDRLYGNGVNVAARIEALAESGGICISRNAYSHVRDKLELGYEYLGEHSVKNIKRPIRVYKVLMNPEDAGKLIGDVPRPAAKIWTWTTAVLAVIVITAVVWQVYQKMTEPEFDPAKVEKMSAGSQISLKPSYGTKFLLGRIEKCFVGLNILGCYRWRLSCHFCSLKLLEVSLSFLHSGLPTFNQWRIKPMEWRILITTNQHISLYL